MDKGIIFDMDGVIIESEQLYMEIDREIFKKYGLELTKEEREKYTGIPLDEIWLKLNQDYNLDPQYNLEDIVEDHVESFYQGLKESDIQLIEGLDTWFNKFKQMNIKMLIASSSFPKIVDYIYQKFNLDRYMEGYVNLDDVKKGKPDPEIFIKAAETMNLSPKDCIVIEDSENGVLAAKRASMSCVAYNGRNSTFQNLDRADLIIGEYNKSNFDKVIALFN